MKKKALALLLCLLLLLGCKQKKEVQTFSAESLMEANSTTNKSMSFVDFNGHKDFDVQIENPATMHFQVAVESGAFEVLITDRKKNTYYQKNGSFEDTITLNGPGLYILRVSGNAAGGSYTITWEETP